MPDFCKPEKTLLSPSKMPNTTKNMSWSPAHQVFINRLQSNHPDRTKADNAPTINLGKPGRAVQKFQCGSAPRTASSLVSLVEVNRSEGAVYLGVWQNTRRFSKA